jgi:hypothetical protein
MDRRQGHCKIVNGFAPYSVIADFSKICKQEEITKITFFERIRIPAFKTPRLVLSDPNALGCAIPLCQIHPLKFSGQFRCG